jgi:hypothetical protein
MAFGLAEVTIIRGSEPFQQLGEKQAYGFGNSGVMARQERARSVESLPQVQRRHRYTEPAVGRPPRLTSTETLRTTQTRVGKESGQVGRPPRLTSIETVCGTAMPCRGGRRVGRPPRLTSIETAMENEERLEDFPSADRLALRALKLPTSSLSLVSILPRTVGRPPRLTSIET